MKLTINLNKQETDYYKKMKQLNIENIDKIFFLCGMYNCGERIGQQIMSLRNTIREIAITN